MESNSSSAIKLFSHHEINRLNCFDGSNFIRWKDKMTFLLTTLKVFYVLSEDLTVIPGSTPDESEDIKKERKKREEDELVCHGHILNSLTDRLYDPYSNMKSPKEIWIALEMKYKNEKKGTNKFLAMNYFDFKLSDSRSWTKSMNYKYYGLYFNSMGCFPICMFFSFFTKKKQSGSFGWGPN